MKTRVVAVACVLMAMVPCGITGCALHSRRPLSRSHGLEGPLQLDTPRDHRVHKDTAPQLEPVPTITQS